MLNNQIKILLFIYCILLLFLYNNFYDYIQENSALIPIFALFISVYNNKLLV
jgi:hypothetical protein